MLSSPPRGDEGLMVTEPFWGCVQPRTLSVSFEQPWLEDRQWGDSRRNSKETERRSEPVMRKGEERGKRWPQEQDDLGAR